MSRKVPEPFTLVIFGASGDLARRKLIPAVYGLFRDGLLPEGFSLVGYARTAKTDENFHIVNAGLLSRMQDGAVVVNTARGAVIDTDALVEELKTGRIQASLDVYEEEPLPADHPLRGLENCQLIPHMGGPTPDRRKDMGRLAVTQVARYLRGEELENVVTAEKYDLIT